MASFGKVLDLLDDRYLELQDVIGNVEPLPTLVPYEEYTQNVLVYRMDTNHEIFMGLIQDFTMRRAHETSKELWTWLVQWEVDNSPPAQQPSSPKKVRLDTQQANALFKAPPTPRQTPALTIFERRTLDGALMLEEDMLRILIDIVQVASSLVPNFIEFLYRWVDYYEGDGKALKAALRWEIPSLWDFEYHPLVLPRDVGKDSYTGKEDDTQSSGQGERRTRSASESKAAELRQSSPTKKMHARPKPDLAAIELRTFYSEESERLQYREVKFGIQPPKLEQPLPPLINIPRDQRKRTKYYAACFKSRQRALYLLLEAGVTMRQINNYQKLQTAHPKETPEIGDGNGLRNYQKDAKYAQAQFELKDKQIKQREIAISNKLAVEAQLAATHAIPDGATGLPLIPPTPVYARKPEMAADMMQRIKETRAKRDERINIVPKPLVDRMKSKVFENARKEPELMPLRDLMAEAEWYTNRSLTVPTALPRRGDENLRLVVTGDRPRTFQVGQIEDKDDNDDEDMGMESDSSNNGGGDDSATAAAAMPVSTPSLPRPTLPLPLPPQPPAATTNPVNTANGFNVPRYPHLTEESSSSQPVPRGFDQSTPPNIATYMQNLNTEQAQHLLPLLSPQARQAATSKIQESSRAQDIVPRTLSFDVGPVRSSSSSQPGYIIDPFILSKLSEASPPRPSSVPLPLGSQGQGTARNVAPNQINLSGPSSAVDPLILPKQRNQNAFPGSPQSLPPSPFGILGQPTPSPVGLQQHTTAEGSRNIPVYALSPTTAGAPSTDAWLASPVSTGFNSEHFMYLRRQQEASGSATTSEGSVQSSQTVLPDTQSALRPQIPNLEPHQQLPAQRQQMLSADFAATNAQVCAAQASQPNTQPAQPPQSSRPSDLTQYRWEFDETSGQLTSRGPVPSRSSLSPSVLSPPLPQPQPQPRPHPLQPLLRPETSNQTPATRSTPPSPYPPPSGAMFPPPRPGITRNAPTPLSLSSPKPSPFTTFAPQVLATSPFLDLSANAGTPIQIYLPAILVPGNGLGPSGTRMGNSGCAETDALLLGHEEVGSGKLVLSKAILVPVGVWENTLRKVRSGRWSVLETYACPSSHPAKGKGKGKERTGDRAEKGCHRAVYDKLAQAYGMMTGLPAVREELLTKRWRVSRGPMTIYDRGAVWEGWGAFVDRGIEMSAAEREGAVKSEVEVSGKVEDGGMGDGYAPYGDAEKERRRREVEELMDEDEDEEMEE
ncbi:hypothetical protein BU25DRAFT_492965 [Macroventuria anomochaeta]|uniref:Uncharacterized protein n=1 Tax=Macroventuria anomochaeta TaxID=301207 RepID=A0ACB6RUC9_9PLEO|nr:uncharacterized protein BU25DRAFT_492965 [Macroventuria anomochaeta]KAF2625322.1 hypothetical protein BU25DRAFT_492965 [Macroventuria anomochaeta]